MRILAALLFSFFLLPVGAAPATDATAVRIDAHRDGGKIMVEGEFSAPVPRELAWQVMVDFDHMTDFMPKLTKSHVLNREGEKLTVNQHGTVHVGFFDVAFDSTREIELKPMSEIDSHSVGGDTGAMHSVATLAQQDQQTVISYRAEWVPTSVLIASFGVSTLKNQLGEQFQAMVHEMIRRAAKTSAKPHD
ncbi:SRPBCC family protein [Andreprevotia chitinilytica]|uniref:SRPBCC family protein n=1 Tax=Andreprevotia chitinilytica TaxID=396808 RepID=UPI00068F156D|nr:SRPBCC family protein [Andreprevotia chitinilytica]